MNGCLKERCNLGTFQYKPILNGFRWSILEFWVDLPKNNQPKLGLGHSTI